MSAWTKARFVFSAQLLFIPLLVSDAVEFSYDSLLPSSPFMLLKDGKTYQLPQRDTVTLFFFPFSAASTMASNYLAALTNCLPQDQLAVYRIALDPTADTSKNPLPVVPQSNLFDPIITSVEDNATDIILLVDKRGRVKYVGPLGSAGKFSSLLRRLGLDVSLRQADVTLLVSGKARLVNIYSDEELTLSDLDADKACKIFLFYLSLCTPCGEHAMVQEILECAKSSSDRDLAVYIVFRQCDQDDANRLWPILDQYGCLDRLYRLENVPPEAERYFLSDLPYIAAFSPDNKFIRSGSGQRMSRQALVKFFRAIGK
ncbi:hypothetical protein JXA02_11540 [candidate division KSB1 bacterium]|nr:hypothetical protein [candidate division KSB1 bacterium]RQW02312.1 MAG: hypothetical protein EH222_13790 [candidate division KSB1 bacterium]